MNTFISTRYMYVLVQLCTRYIKYAARTYVCNFYIYAKFAIVRNVHHHPSQFINCVLGGLTLHAKSYLVSLSLPLYLPLLAIFSPFFFPHWLFSTESLHVGG